MRSPIDMRSAFRRCLRFMPCWVQRSLRVRSKFAGLLTIIQYARSGMLLDPDRAVFGVLLLPDRHDRLQLVDGLARRLERGVAMRCAGDDHDRDITDREIADAVV